MSGSGVKIDIGANPSTVVSAFDRIQAALARARREAIDFSAVDLGHPELAALEDQIKRITLAMQAMRAAAGIGPLGGTTGPGPGMAPGTIGPPPRPPVAPPPPPQPAAAPGRPVVPPPANPAVPTPPPPPPPRLPPPPSGGGGGGGGGAQAVISSLLGGPVGFALSLAGLGGIKSLVGSAVGRAQSEAVDNDRLLRTLRDSTLDFDKLRDSVRKSADTLGVTFGDAQALSRRYASVAGSEIGSVVDRSSFAAQFARGMGIDRMSGVDMFARGENAGVDPKQLAIVTAEVTQGGGLQGRQQEVLEALLRWSTTASRVLVSQNNMAEFAGLYRGLNATGLPGLRGENATGIISSLNQATMNGGNAGMAGNVFLYRALRATGVSDPADQQMLYSGGIFANASEYGGRNTTVLEAEIAELNRVYGRGSSSRKSIGFSNFSGLGPRQSQAFLDNYTEIAKHHVGGLIGFLRSAHVDMNHINPEGLADLAEIEPASPARLDEIRAKVLSGRSSSQLSTKQRDDLKAASGTGLRNLLAQDFAKNGMIGTTGSATSDATAAMENAFTAAATPLVGALNGMKEGITALTSEFNKAITLFQQFLTDNKGDANKIITPDQPDGHGPLSGFGLGNGGVLPIAFQTGGGGGGGGMNSGSGGNPLASAALRSRIQQGIAFFEEKGYSHNAAAAAVANLYQESGLNEKAVGDHVTAFGGGQWHADRLRDIMLNGGIDPTRSYLDTLRAYDWEMQHGQDPGMRAAGRYLKEGGHSAAEMGGYLSMHGERPRDVYGQMRVRGGLADDLAKMPSGGFGGTAGGTATIKPLQVIHMTQTGKVLGTETLPVTVAPQPLSWSM